MKFGIQTLFGGKEASKPEYVVATGKGAEDRGFASIWVAEHVVAFEKYNSPYPYSEDGIPPFTTENGIIEPLTALSFLAAQTSKIRLGTGIVILPQRNPVYTAKQAADVDVLSGGRLDFGIGLGWSAQEYEACATPFDRRGRRAWDYLNVMRSLWTEDLSSYEGEFYTLPECVQGPKPVQTPHMPLYFGGESDPALRRVSEFGQGWLGYQLTPQTLPERLEKLGDMLEERGRSLADIQIAISPYDTTLDLDTVKRFSDLGVHQLVTIAFADNVDGMLAQLDKLAEELVVPGANI